MNNINFLPQSFITDYARRRRIIRQMALILTVATVIACWYGVTSRQVSERARFIKQVTEGTEASAHRVAELAKLQAQRAALLHQVKVQRELAQSISHTAIIDTIASLLPSELAMTSLTMRTQQPKPMTRAEAASAKSNKAKPVGGAGDDAELIHIEMVGLSPSDIEVANFVGELASNPLFINVKMLYSRATTVGTYEAREFRVELETPLDRDYRDPARSVAAVQEVAHAD